MTMTKGYIANKLMIISTWEMNDQQLGYQLNNQQIILVHTWETPLHNLANPTLPSLDAPHSDVGHCWLLSAYETDTSGLDHSVDEDRVPFQCSIWLSVSPKKCKEKSLPSTILLDDLLLFEINIDPAERINVGPPGRVALVTGHNDACNVDALLLEQLKLYLADTDGVGG
jgi:hypothetical protein